MARGEGMDDRGNLIFHKNVLVAQEDIATPQMKRHSPSQAKAFFLSFILPGAGEYYMGSRKMAKIFLGTEVFLWATYFSFRTYGNWKKTDYMQYAAAHAGVNPDGKDHQYFVDVENYRSIRHYNEAKLRQRNVEALYPENEAYSWQWDSDESREKFEKLRIASDSAYNRSKFVIAGIILNHIISGIDAIRLARKGEAASRKQLHLGVSGLSGGGMEFFVIKSF